MIGLLLAVVLSGSGTKPAPIQVDMLELNHKLSESKCYEFDQVILWQWSAEYRRYDAHHWFLPKGTVEYPTKTGGFYQCKTRLVDGREVVFRAKMFRETWTEDDPERQNAKVFPVDMRRRINCAR